jgi:hypothetical protein
MLFAGLALGLTIGGALAAGVFLGQWGGRSTAGIPALEELRLKAAASHGSDTFAVATGPVDEDVEGLYTLDFVTGDLQCFVINPRNGAFGGWFKTNVANVMGVEKGKKPNYLMVTGQMNVAGGQRLAGSMCYVVDANTGDAAAFTFPWSKSVTAAGGAIATEMIPIRKWKARSLDLRQ